MVVARERVSLTSNQNILRKSQDLLRNVVSFPQQQHSEFGGDNPLLIPASPRDIQALGRFQTEVPPVETISGRSEFEEDQEANDQESHQVTPRQPR